jgi:hypothetical protein
MIFILYMPDQDSVSPAGAIEIISSGGLTDDDIGKIRSITLEDSNLFGLPRIYKTVFRPEERSEELSSISALDIYNSNKSNFKVVT